MNTDELEALLNGAEETDTLEFKGAMAWDRQSLVRDILALANVIDGGRIVIGVEDNTYARQGLTPEQIATFDAEVMRDQIAPFADPRVVFRRIVAADRQGLQFVIIDVSPFDEGPVICKRDGTEVNAGTIYFRSRTRRPQSARVDNSADMRDIIERAAALAARRLRRLGFVAEQGDQDYDAELGGL
ncbi:ATP-binding protein [Caulobacter sp. D4A]|uniref:AlbA family DNA-binding domain-containing protein n=1 Tax=unclassified Caulobacter TaxID=2648921 RepID=UPI000D736B17|nr:MULTISPECIES: ATP-binding protein [unclassified Caulobacter]PXA89507.1 ATP-binding protein [Caulobacter sp. D5]PXA94868.1 ATP-binding protein [Caulobacter sp. D4A]